MVESILGRKIKMTQIFNPEGAVVPVTAVEAGPCVILEINEEAKKIKVGFEKVKEKKAKKPQLGYFKKLGLNPMRYIREFPSAENKDYQVGQEIKADIFKPGDYVNVTGTSIGKGFQGGMKRWGWSGGPSGHGSMHHRRIGSVGASADPSRVFKGMHMPGHMGAKRITIQNLRVMDVDAENNILLIQGALPGAKNSLVVITRSKKKAWRSLEEKRAASVAVKRNPMKQSKAKAKGKK